MADPERVPYDEFGLFAENIAEFDLAADAIPEVRRVDVEVPHDVGRHVSGLVWGDGDAEVVFVHGGAQNAHTWDTVVLALGRPALAVDLPGHGHSQWRADGAYTPMNLADDIASVIAELAPRARAIVGMSLGGLTAMEVAVRHPALVRHLVMVDITPGVNQQKAKAVIDFVDGPQDFPSFDDLLKRTMEHNPTRSESSLRRGILHNAAQAADGSWHWRYDRSSHARSRDADPPLDDRSDAGRAEPVDIEPSEGSSASNEMLSDGSPHSLWDDFGATTCPLTLVRGSVSPVVDDDDVEESRRRRPDLDLHVVDGAGHSVQGDRPVELAAILATLLA